MINKQKEKIMTTKDENQRKAYVLDTSVLEHDPQSILKFQEHDVIILTTVLEEIDHLKKGEDSKAYIAREVHRMLDLFGEVLIPKPTVKKGNGPAVSSGRKVSALFYGGVPLGEGLGKIEVKTVPRKIHQSVKELYFDENQDNRILSAVSQMQQENKEKKRIILVSKDINLRLKAKSLGIEVEDYENDKIPSITQLYLGREEISNVILDDAIDKLHKAKEILIFNQSYSECFNEENIVPNKFFVLKNGEKKSVLVRVDQNREYFHLVEKRTISGITPRNSEQVFTFDALLQDHLKLITLLGKAGTGKTLLAMATAIHLLTQEKDKRYENIVIASAMVTLSNKNMGALPGNAEEKVLPYMQGLYDNLSLIKSKNKGNRGVIDSGAEEKPAKRQKQNPPPQEEHTQYLPNKSKNTKPKAASVEENLDYITKLQKEGSIQIQPLAYVRGRTFNNTVFIIDEAQNLTPHEAKTIITRAGENCKVIFCGDIEQIDSPHLDARSSGLSYVVYKMSGKAIVAHVTLEKGERSELAELAADLL